MNFSFNLHNPNSTKLYNYDFRITEQGQLEQFVTVIQHRDVENKRIGIKSSWEPVFVEGVPVFVNEENVTIRAKSNRKEKDDSGVIRILLKAPGGFRNVLGSGKFFVDHEGFLNMKVNIFDGHNTILTEGYVMNGPSRLIVCTG